jgi:hypothetical protein
MDFQDIFTFLATMRNLALVSVALWLAGNLAWHMIEIADLEMGQKQKRRKIVWLVVSLIAFLVGLIGAYKPGFWL